MTYASSSYYPDFQSAVTALDQAEFSCAKSKRPDEKDIVRVPELAHAVYKDLLKLRVGYA